MIPVLSDTSYNLWLQKFAALKPLASFFSLLGNEEFFLLLLPLVYLCYDRRVGARLGVLVLGSEAANVCLKVLFALPRPYWIDTRVQSLGTDASFGMPSSHAQNAAAVWPFLVRRRALSWRLAAAIVVAGIALSRVFLGVHFVGDVVVGVLLGVAFLWAFLKILPRLEPWFESQSAVRQAITAFAVALAMLAVFWICQVLAPSRAAESWGRYADFDAGVKAIAGRAGAMCGLLIGAGACARRGLFEARGTAAEKALRFVVAIVGALLFWRVLPLLLPKEPLALECVFRFARYGLMAWWITDATPRFFERKIAASLAARTEPAST